MAIDHLTVSQIASLLSYEPETGRVYRTAHTPRPKRGHSPQSVLGEIRRKPNARGYVAISVIGKSFYAHRIAWLLHYGRWPNAHLDHINGDKADNRICNLRVCDASTNQQNIRAAKAGNTTGLLGVTVDRESGKFVAQISYNHRHIHLGRFDSADLAHAAYRGAKRAIHKACTL